MAVTGFEDLHGTEDAAREPGDEPDTSDHDDDRGHDVIGTPASGCEAPPKLCVAHIDSRDQDQAGERGRIRR